MPHLLLRILAEFTQAQPTIVCCSQVSWLVAVAMSVGGCLLHTCKPRSATLAANGHYFTHVALNVWIIALHAAETPAGS
jgi:hypothetical protein